MTDRELLEAAAKSAGLHGFWCDAGLYMHTDDWPKIWNPLTDDGDALRLAVKLRINIVPGFHAEWSDDKGGVGREFVKTAEYEADPYAATRRAIVRAAAQIGSSKGESNE